MNFYLQNLLTDISNYRIYITNIISLNSITIFIDSFPKSTSTYTKILIIVMIIINSNCFT